MRTPGGTLERMPHDENSRSSTELASAALLAAGRQLNAAELARLLDIGERAVPAVMAELGTVLAESALGLKIEEVAGGWRLVVDPRLVPALAPLLEPPPLPRLSNAALETLALVAYRQPVTRGELEAARGASCSSTLETLQERQLVKQTGVREVIGRPALWGTTERFLLEFGLRSLEDLPPLEEFQTDFLRG